MMKYNKYLLLLALPSLFIHFVKAMDSVQHLVIVGSENRDEQRIKSLFSVENYSRTHNIEYPITTFDWLSDLHQKNDFVNLIHTIYETNNKSKIKSQITVYASGDRAAACVNWIAACCRKEVITSIILDNPQLSPGNFPIFNAMKNIHSVQMLIIQPEIMTSLNYPPSSRDASIFHTCARKKEGTTNTYLVIEKKEKIKPALIQKILSNNASNYIHIPQDFEETMAHNCRALENQLIFKFIIKRLLLVSTIIFAVYSMAIFS